MDVLAWAFALALFGAVVSFALREQKLQRKAGEPQQRLKDHDVATADAVRSEGELTTAW